MSREALRIVSSDGKSLTVLLFSFRSHLPSLIAFPLVTALACATAAHAELGGGMVGIRSDGARMNARIASRGMDRFTRHELTRGNGGTVRELTNAQGKVFAVTWSGPGKPDLRALLGPSFAALEQSAVGGSRHGRMLHSLRRPPQVSQADLQIQTGGHMGWFHGIAYIPSLAPQSFSTTSLTAEQ